VLAPSFACACINSCIKPGHTLFAGGILATQTCADAMPFYLEQRPMQKVGLCHYDCRPHTSKAGMKLELDWDRGRIFDQEVATVYATLVSLRVGVATFGEPGPGPAAVGCSTFFLGPWPSKTRGTLTFQLWHAGIS